MKRIAVIKDGVVANVIIDNAGIECPPEVGIGWAYDGEKFVAPQVDPNIALLAQIAALELRADSPRARREALLGNTAFIKSLDDQIKVLRGQLQ